MKPALGCLTVLAFTAALVNAVTIRNDQLRYTTDGQIVDSHDGSLLDNRARDGLFYFFGTVYGNCSQPGPQCAAPCGYTPNRYAVYSSPNLENDGWTLVSDDVLPAVDPINHQVDFWMPDVGFNPQTNKYVMQYWSSQCGFTHPCANIATSATPGGPFVPAAPIVLSGGTPSSQMGLFVDHPDSAGVVKAYVKYNTIGPNQQHVIEELTPDWMNSTGRFATIFPKTSFPWREGGGLWRQSGGLYYYMTGSDCCFCSWGGDARWWTAAAPLGPWHPGVLGGTPSLCDLTGTWVSGTDPSNKITVQQTGSTFTVVQGSVKASGSVETNGYVHVDDATLAPLGRPGVVTNDYGTAAGCDRVRWYGQEDGYWCRSGVVCRVPDAQFGPPQVNGCSGGVPPVYGNSHDRHNPCDPNDAYGTNFTVPAQQFNVFDIMDADGSQQVLFFGERSKSAPDGLKSHNFQAWVPIHHQADGSLVPLTFPSHFNISL